jgi:hypothetical protein
MLSNLYFDSEHKHRQYTVTFCFSTCPVYAIRLYFRTRIPGSTCKVSEPLGRCGALLLFLTMTSTIQRFEQVLTKFERARPEYTSARDAQWERHDQPTIKLSLDTAKSPTKDLESVRLRVVWTFGKDQMAVLVRNTRTISVFE